MQLKLIACSLVLLAPLPAFAQTNPCARGASAVKMSGVDLDELKCRLSVTEGALSAQISQAIVMQAETRMLQSDLAVARADAEKARSEATQARAEAEKARSEVGRPPK